MRKNGYTKRAFTLIELLVVIAIIAMLVGIISVGVRKAMISAKNLRQKAVFHSITVGLELFSKDFDGYPSSAATSNAGSPPLVCGAQHLAEALIGRDNGGFDPRTKWYPPNEDPAVDPYIYSSTEAQSLNRRKEPYCDIKSDSIYSIYQLWTAGVGTSQIFPSAVGGRASPVITDIFDRNSVDLPAPISKTIRVGMPILYFRADGAKRFRVDQARQLVTNPTPAQYKPWVYNYDDNLPVVALPWLQDPAKDGVDEHYQDPADNTKNNAQVFYEKITETADATRNFYKPHNPNGFLLISAGWDGRYGTSDDITNFGE